MREIDDHYFAKSFIFLIAKLKEKYCLSGKDYDFFAKLAKFAKII